MTRRRNLDEIEASFVVILSHPRQFCIKTMLRFDVVWLLLVSAIDHCRRSMSHVSRSIVNPVEPRVVGGPFQTWKGDAAHNQRLLLLIRDRPLPPLQCPP